MGVIISRGDTGNIKVTFPYNPAYLRKIKTIPGRKRHPGILYISTINGVIQNFSVYLIVGPN